MLRAVRFAAAFQFTIEPETLCAIQEMAPGITAVSAERIGVEIRRMLINANRATALSLLRDTNLLPHVLPEVAALPTTAFAETQRQLSALQKPSIALALAALLGKSSAGNEGAADSSALPTSHSPLPTPPSPLLPTLLGRRLRYTNKEIDRSAWLLANRHAIIAATELPWPRLQRLLTHEGAAELLALHEAAAGSANPALAFCRERLAWPAERLNPPPLIDGADLIRHGLDPGPHFASLLEQARDAQLEGKIQTRDEALALVDRLRAAPETLP
jgi:hypothetical protein